MTTAGKRYSSLRAAGEFLRDLSNDQSISEEIRERAAVIVAHYPGVVDIDILALLSPGFLSRDDRDDLHSWLILAENTQKASRGLTGWDN